MTSLGGTASLNAFLALAESQYKNSGLAWNNNYTADGANTYIRAGFNMTPVAGATRPALDTAAAGTKTPATAVKHTLQHAVSPPQTARKSRAHASK
jgi:hypothetical protein